MAGHSALASRQPTASNLVTGSTRLAYDHAMVVVDRYPATVSGSPATPLPATDRPTAGFAMSPRRARVQAGLRTKGGTWT